MNGRHRSRDLSSAAVRRATSILLTCLALCLMALPASADAVDSAVAATRGSGLPIQGDAEATANASAARQAANGAMSHASIGHMTSVCNRAAEIVGAGPSIELIFTGFRASPNHMSKLLDPGWTSMGTGVATGADGTVYVAVVFCQGGAIPTPSPTPAPTPLPTSPPAPATGASLSPPPSSAPEVLPATDSAPTLIDVDIMGLITAVLNTSLDSLTAEPDGDMPMAALLQRFVHLQNGISII